MKHQATFRTTALIIAIFALTASNAQMAKNKAIKPEALLKTSVSVKAISELDNSKLEELKTINEKLYQNFTRNFKGASDILVTPSKRTTGVYCMVDGIRNNILFTNKGTWMHTVRYYTPELLPESIKSIIRQDLPEYKMLHVKEVSTPAGTAHLVDVETHTMHKTIRVVNGEWDVYSQFFKQ